MSAAVIASNTSIKIQREAITGTTGSTVDILIYTATSNQYTEVYYLELASVSGGTWTIKDTALGLSLYSGVTAFNKISEDMQPFMVYANSADTKPAHPKRLVIPPGCGLYVKATNGSFPITYKFLGLTHINSP